MVHYSNMGTFNVLMYGNGICTDLFRTVIFRHAVYVKQGVGGVRWSSM